METTDLTAAQKEQILKAVLTLFNWRNNFHHYSKLVSDLLFDKLSELLENSDSSEPLATRDIIIPEKHFDSLVMENYLLQDLFYNLQAAIDENSDFL
jgi:hypothetical protein